MTYYALGSTTGKCNLMGYWHTGNTALQQPNSAIRNSDAAVCTTDTLRSTNDIRSTPLVDFGASDSLLKATDYTYYPDLLMLPAIGGGVVPIYNIPELGSNPLVLSRTTIANIFLGKCVIYIL